MSKRKIIICSLLILLTILSISGVYYFKTNKGTINNKNISKSNLAIIINSNGVESNVNEVPKRNYTLNEEKTVCENGGKVKSYDSSTGKIGFSFLGSDRCTLYFDEIIDNEPPGISNLNVSGNLVTATLSDNENLLGYGLSTSNTIEPSSYTQISGKTYNLSLNVTSEGTYYLWVKDGAGNKEVSNAINISKKGWQTILANNGGKEAIEAKGDPDFSVVATTNEGMYAMDDDLGTSYYFRGAVDNNWVKFGKDSSNNDMYWRIIRINGDGSIRMIYTGTTAPTESTKVVMTGEGVQIGTSKYSNGKSSSIYVGYQYVNNKQFGYGKCDGSNASCKINTSLTINNSEIKQTIDKWYVKTTLYTNENIKNYISNEIFCNDRSVTDGTWTSKGNISSVYYASKTRLETNKTPLLKCATNDDMFTTDIISLNENLSLGNGALTYPVGLINADEVALAGGVMNTQNSSYYLNTEIMYWTISPISYGTSTSNVFNVQSSGKLYADITGSYYGVRPVINLSSNVKLSGNGTYNNVYTVS